MERSSTTANLGTRICLCHYTFRPMLGPRETGEADTGRRLTWWIIAACIATAVAEEPWSWLPLQQPKTNVWVTLANVTNLDTLCLATATPGNPLSTCFVGIPLETWPIPLQAPYRIGTGAGQVENWDGWTSYLPEASLDPQELDLSGSIKMDYCLFFSYLGSD